MRRGPRGDGQDRRRGGRRHQVLHVQERAVRAPRHHRGGPRGAPRRHAPVRRPARAVWRHHVLRAQGPAPRRVVVRRRVPVRQRESAVRGGRAPLRRAEPHAVRRPRVLGADAHQLVRRARVRLGGAAVPGARAGVPVGPHRPRGPAHEGLPSATELEQFLPRALGRHAPRGAHGERRRHVVPRRVHGAAHHRRRVVHVQRHAHHGGGVRHRRRAARPRHRGGGAARAARHGGARRARRRRVRRVRHVGLRRRAQGDGHLGVAARGERRRRRGRVAAVAADAVRGAAAPRRRPPALPAQPRRDRVARRRLRLPQPAVVPAAARRGRRRWPRVGLAVAVAPPGRVRDGGAARASRRAQHDGAVRRVPPAAEHGDEQPVAALHAPRGTRLPQRRRRRAHVQRPLRRPGRRRLRHSHRPRGTLADARGRRRIVGLRHGARSVRQHDACVALA
mmetsp:Transcript_31079/g.76069  ORF Transcript_31079/g.76069 Transcript_31079/m.76069 type:complete len:449 (+) Transcript_31079:168-1514(+)